MFLKGENSDMIRTDAGVRHIFAAKAWVNQDVFIRWVNYEFPFVGSNTVLLVFDSARSHIANKVKAHLHRRGIFFAVIPVA